MHGRVTSHEQTLEGGPDMRCSVSHLARTHRRLGVSFLPQVWLFALLLSCMGWIGAAKAQAAPPEASPEAPETDTEPLTGDTAPVHIEDRELISLILGLTVAAVIFFNRKAIRSLPGAGWWVAAFFVRLLAWTLSVVENIFWPDTLNTVEHLALMISTGLTAIAVWKTFGIHGEKQPLST